ncbi:T6SS effector amidase Tae4 family protein [Sphingomonas pseudosanguinis]|uniref:Cytoplasmic protein n=1 Tax=Sphingomonas pseudosanguinis TaxID=413712 RepID=A0A7W6AHE0_9SPHN|nr:T6SS effector amidase Tae4 family protein [Sphingomonas pseudosanguinis]MBB3880601.1 hypothetical protein [Sphingomonas pseudosanguinis]MBN3538504.1 hypothetical protein [Sphingomonas pseudosanguinis]
MAKPVLAKIWSAFPDHEAYPSLRDLYSHLGGAAARNIEAPGFGPNGNTCASRLSVAFNKGGAPINAVIARAAGAQTLGVADGARIIFRVTEFRAYLLRLLGKPLVDNASPYDSAFRGKRGIVAFTVNWSDASGHIALWDGVRYREPGHDNYATYTNGSAKTSRGEFWELA